MLSSTIICKGVLVLHSMVYLSTSQHGLSVSKVWITAQKQDLISGVYFWPGSETDFNGSRPHFYFEYTE